MEKYTNGAIIDIIEDEGLGYAVQQYLSPEKIEDEELSKLWKKAAKALAEIENYLYE